MNVQNNENLLLKKSTFLFKRQSKNLKHWMSEVIENKHYREGAQRSGLETLQF